MLVGDVKTFGQFARVHKNFNFKSFLPFLDETKLYPVLSEPLYAKLHKAYEDDTLDLPENKVLKGLLPLSQKYLVYKALYEGFHELRNHVSELGIQQSFSDSADTSRPSPVADAKALRLTYCQNAYKALDDIYLYLEKNQKDNSLADWLASPSYTMNYELLVRNATEMSKFVSTVNSRQTYLAVRPQIRQSELLHTKKILGADLYQDLLAYVRDKEQDKDLSIYPPEYEILLPICQAVIANDALFRAIAFLDVYLEGGNLYLSEYMSPDYTAKTTNERNIEQLRQQVRADRDSWQLELSTFLAQNAKELPKALPAVEAKTCSYGGNGSNFSIRKKR